MLTPIRKPTLTRGRYAYHNRNTFTQIIGVLTHHSRAAKNFMRVVVGLTVVIFGVLLGSCHAHYTLPVNPVLGVPGYPDCERANPHLALSVEEAAQDLICQQQGEADTIKETMPLTLSQTPTP